MMKTDEELAPFAPDQDEPVDDDVIEAALLRLTPDLTKSILASDDDGNLPMHVSRVHLRSMILHGLAEIFDPSLTPLGLAVRRRIQ